HVTGVQTCALPICELAGPNTPHHPTQGNQSTHGHHRDVLRFPLRGRLLERSAEIAPEGEEPAIGEAGEPADDAEDDAYGLVHPPGPGLEQVSIHHDAR